MSYTITITDPTLDETRKLISMLQASIGEHQAKLVDSVGNVSRCVEGPQEWARATLDAIDGGQALTRESATLVVPPSVVEWVGSEIDRLAAEQERDLSEEPTLSELSAAIQHDPSVFTAAPQPSAGAPSTAVVAPAPIAPEAPPASLTVPPAPPVPVPAPAAPEVAQPAPAAPSAVALDAEGLPWDARIHSSSKEKVKAGTWKYRRGVEDAEVATVEAELRQLMAIPAPAATLAPPPPPAPAALPPVVQAMNAITPLIASKRADTPVILAKLAEMGLRSPADFNARPDLLPEFIQWTATLLKPSAAARWVKCPGSVTMEEAFPEETDGPEAMEGHAAHWVNEQMWFGADPAPGSSAPNGAAITDEMLEGAAMWCEALESCGLDRGEASSWRIETPVPVPRVHDQCWGTPDAWAWAPETKTLYVADYKFGHRYVDAFENWQLMTYAAGCLSEVVEPVLPAIEFIVVQPRAFGHGAPVRRWRITAEELRPYVQQLFLQAHRALDANPQCVVNDECRDCKARHACNAHLTACGPAADMAYKAVPLELGPESLGVLLRMIHQAQARLKVMASGLEEQALEYIKRGHPVPHFQAQASQGRKRWTLPDAEIIAMGQLMGVDLAKPPEAITPTQASKLAIDGAVISSYSETPSGAVKLVAHDSTEARKVFK
jgi:hypothetical protein